MITANELRVGNYVASDHFKDRDVIVKVRLIGQEQAIVEHPNGLTEPMLYQGEMRGVKLTEEILLKLGYVILNEYSAGIRYGYVVNGVFHSGLTFVYWKESNDLVCVIKHIKYLHQLQNLFYVLTGEELEVNL